MSKGRRLWSEEDIQWLKENWRLPDSELSEKLGRSVGTIRTKRAQLGLIGKPGSRQRDWSEKELNYIREVWGEKTIPQIASHLGRSINAVKIKTARLGYTGQKWYGSMMSARKVAELLGVDVHAVCDRWIPKYGLKAKKRRLGESKKTTTIIMFDDLLAWIRDHQDLWDSRRLELYALGMEYDWLKEKRKADLLRPERAARKWTREEDARLVAMFRRGDMTYAQIAAELGRPENGVEHRVNRLDVWGTGKYIGDSTRGLRKEWKRSFEQKALMIRLRNVLLAHRNSIEFGQYWQKDLCRHWDGVSGCSAGCADCDSCTAFERIQPQYCARCGGTFYERTENRFCAPCRAARKKRAQRRWCRGKKGAYKEDIA